VHAEAPATNSPRLFRLDEVKQHGKSAERIWVTRGTEVFDITDWIAAHPGGPVILNAAGGSIDAYWDIFSIHKKQDVYDVLREYCIGEIDPCDLVDGKIGDEGIQDPFENDPVRDSSLIQHTAKPCNAETPSSSLKDFITPNETFYVRNHFWVPRSDEKSHVLTVELPDGTEKGYSVDELKKKFKPCSITATLQCSGNRRQHMNSRAHKTSGLPWQVGAISNAEWTGVRLMDLLTDAGFDRDDSEDAKHVQFVGAEAYGASIPIEKAMDHRGDVLLAYEMNGKPLPPDHGYPLRALVPGNTAARSVKWVEKIVLSEEESQSQWQQKDYKLFGPNCQTAKDIDWTDAPAIQETPVQSAITTIKAISSRCHDGRKELEREGLSGNAFHVAGYAFSGGGRQIVRVDVSADGGKTWRQARLLPDASKGSQSWSWKRWQIAVPENEVKGEFVVKAVDCVVSCQVPNHRVSRLASGIETFADPSPSTTPSQNHMKPTGISGATSRQRGIEWLGLRQTLVRFLLELGFSAAILPVD
jgi:sulfite oxidase